VRYLEVYPNSPHWHYKKYMKAGEEIVQVIYPNGEIKEH